MDVELYEWVAARIRERRTVLGLTQAHLAALAGIGRSSLANIETGRQAILLHDVLALARSLDVKLDELLPPTSTERENHDELPRSVQLFVQTMIPKEAGRRRRR